ncbi:hypothetical protein [Arthrobacter sp. KNU40]|uniref:hypothetical protein n=1 Tax=Arthrobacter sp. KNU40 TaxID=3447965 RepID=UPI003F5F2449
MQPRHVTATVAHSKTRNAAEVSRRAHILIVATGVPELIGREDARPGRILPQPPGNPRILDQSKGERHC